LLKKKLEKGMIGYYEQINTINSTSIHSASLSGNIAVMKSWKIKENSFKKKRKIN